MTKQQKNEHIKSEAISKHFRFSYRIGRFLFLKHLFLLCHSSFFVYYWKISWLQLSLQICAASLNVLHVLSFFWWIPIKNKCYCYCYSNICFCKSCFHKTWIAKQSKVMSANEGGRAINPPRDNLLKYLLCKILVLLFAFCFNYFAIYPSGNFSSNII